MTTPWPIPPSDRTVTVTPAEIAAIKGVKVTAVTSLGSVDLDEARGWMELWLHEQPAVTVAESLVELLMDNCQLTRQQAIRQAIVDHALDAWILSLGDDCPREVGRVSVTPIV
jgi:hypothetical protein